MWVTEECAVHRGQHRWVHVFTPIQNNCYCIWALYWMENFTIQKIKIKLHSSYCLPFYFPPLLLKTFVDGLRNGRLHQIDITYNQRCKCISQVLVEPPILEVVYQTSKYFYSIKFTQTISSLRQVFRLHQWRCSQFCMHNKIHTARYNS